jgi:hypothetical protein
MPKAEAFVTLRINGKIIEAQCSLCRDIIFRAAEDSKIEDQEKDLRDAADRHSRLRHSERAT